MKLDNNMQIIDLSEILDENFGDKVDVRKFQSRLLSDVDATIKTDACYLCGAKCSSYCKSHSIPAFSLKYIAQNGKLLNCNSIFDSKYQDQVDGVKKAGVFFLICDKCDNEVFQDYENEDNYILEPTNIMLTQIALKNTIRSIWAKKRQIEMLQRVINIYPAEFYKSQYCDHINTLPLLEKDFNYARKALQGNNDSKYRLQLFLKLPYRIPFAFQGAIELFFDLSGNVINNIYDKSSTHNNQSVHIAILPLKQQSVIIMFTEKNKMKYRNFFHQLERFSESEKLEIINFIIFAYTDEYMISPTVPNTILHELKQMASKGIDIKIKKDKSVKVSKSKLIASATNKLRDQYSFSQRHIISNLLHEQFKLDTD